MTKLTIKSDNSPHIEILNILNNLLRDYPDIKNFFFNIVFFDGITKNIEYDCFFNFKIDRYLSVLKYLKNINQLFEITILVDKNKETLEKLSYSVINDESEYEKAYMCISYFDGGFWEITSRDEYLLKLIHLKFK